MNAFGRGENSTSSNTISPALKNFCQCLILSFKEAVREDDEDDARNNQQSLSDDADGRAAFVQFREKVRPGDVDEVAGGDWQEVMS